MSYNDKDDYKRDIRIDSVSSHGEPPNHHSHSAHSRRPSRFWLFVFSFLPGLGHIYMGLIRRGLFYISTLALIIFFTSVVVPNFGRFSIFAGFSIAALFAVSFFEAFSIRRDIIMGKEVKDTIPNLGIFGKNKVIIIILAVIFVIVLAVNILSALPWYVWLILGIIAVCYAPAVYGNKRKEMSDKENDNTM